MKSDRLHTRLFVMSLITMYALPLLNIAVISPLSATFYSNIIYPAVLGDIFSYLYTALGIVSVFAGASCLVYAVTAGRDRLLTALLCGVSIPVQYGVIALVDAWIYGKAQLTAAYAVYSVSSALFELLRFGIILLVCTAAAVRAKKKNLPMSLELLSFDGALSRGNFWGAAVITAFMLFSNISETLSLLLGIGAPVNMSETLTLISPYIITAISAILGYFLMHLLMRMLHGKEISVTELR
ncbi:MAG: hypothetical protein E7632_00165 [Ruminococcaceae bacterium]|nr:hypothetical protein [Oscillospiraceae bacterium]